MTKILMVTDSQLKNIERRELLIEAVSPASGGLG
jgi:hypothetical protein